jgi:hypothetical protein
MKAVPGQPHGPRFMAAKLKVVPVQRLVVKAENGDAHEYVAPVLRAKSFVWAVYPVVFFLLIRLSLLVGYEKLL